VKDWIEVAIEIGHAPTLAGVARLAGVSLKTASRVLNNPKNVSEEKVKRFGLR
jgi:hypothetical protein